MTVAELIECLKELPQDEKVLSFNPIVGSYVEMQKEYIMHTLEGFLL